MMEEPTEENILNELEKYVAIDGVAKKKERIKSNKIIPIVHPFVLSSLILSSIEWTRFGTFGGRREEKKHISQALIGTYINKRIVAERGGESRKNAAMRMD